MIRTYSHLYFYYRFNISFALLDASASASSCLCKNYASRKQSRVCYKRSCFRDTHILFYPNWKYNARSPVKFAKSRGKKSLPLIFIEYIIFPIFLSPSGVFVLMANTRTHTDKRKLFFPPFGAQGAFHDIAHQRCTTGRKIARVTPRITT